MRSGLVLPAGPRLTAAIISHGNRSSNWTCGTWIMRASGWTSRFCGGRFGRCFAEMESASRGTPRCRNSWAVPNLPNIMNNHFIEPRALLIVGAGGLGTEFAWIAAEMNTAADRNGAACRPWQILGYADDAPGKKRKTLGRYLVHGTIRETAETFVGRDVTF